MRLALPEFTQTVCRVRLMSVRHTDASTRNVQAECFMGECGHYNFHVGQCGRVFHNVPELFRNLNPVII